MNGVLPLVVGAVLVMAAFAGLWRRANWANDLAWWRAVAADRVAVSVGLGFFAFAVGVTVTDNESSVGLLPSLLFCAVVAAAVARTRLWFARRRKHG